MLVVLNLNYNKLEVFIKMRYLTNNTAETMMNVVLKNYFNDFVEKDSSITDLTNAIIQVEEAQKNLEVALKEYVNAVKLYDEAIKAAATARGFVENESNNHLVESFEHMLNIVDF